MSDNIKKYIAELVWIEPNGVIIDSSFWDRKSLVGISGDLYILEDSINKTLGGQYAVLYDEQRNHLRTNHGVSTYLNDKLVFTTQDSRYTLKIIQT